MSCDIAHLGMAGLLHYSAIVDERQQALGTHWVQHYVGLGIPIDRMTIHFISPNGHAVAAFSAQLRAQGVHDVRWKNRSWSSADMSRVMNTKLADDSSEAGSGSDHGERASDICMYVMLSYAVMRLFASHSAYMYLHVLQYGLCTGTGIASLRFSKK